MEIPAPEVPGVDFYPYSDEQKRAIAQLRGLCSQDWKADDNTLFRFLAARKWNVPKALEMFETAMRWRAANDIDRFRRHARGPFGPEAAIEAETSSFESCMGVESLPQIRLVQSDSTEAYWHAFCGFRSFGHSREGEPIYWEKTGLCSGMLAAAFKVVPSKVDFVTRHIFMQELAMARMDEATARFGKRINKQVVVFDMAGLEYWPNPGGIALYKEVTRIDSAYYPETLAHLFIINVPSIFPPLWRMVERWLDPVTANKVHLCKRSDTLATLSRYISPDNIPAEFGGTNSFVIAAPTGRMDEGQRYAAEIWKHYRPLPEQPPAARALKCLRKKNASLQDLALDVQKNLASLTLCASPSSRSKKSVKFEGSSLTEWISVMYCNEDMEAAKILAEMLLIAGLVSPSKTTQRTLIKGEGLKEGGSGAVFHPVSSPDRRFRVLSSCGPDVRQQKRRQKLLDALVEASSQQQLASDERIQTLEREVAALKSSQAVQQAKPSGFRWHTYVILCLVIASVRLFLTSSMSISLPPLPTVIGFPAIPTIELPSLPSMSQILTTGNEPFHDEQGSFVGVVAFLDRQSFVAVALGISVILSYNIFWPNSTNAR